MRSLLRIGIVFFSVAVALYIALSRDGCALTSISRDPVQGHLSANEFARQVGEQLKVHFPSKVIDPQVELRIYRKNGVRYFEHRWSCRIVPATDSQADFFFDRRGALSSGSTLEEAKAAVKKEIESSGKVQLLIDSFEKTYGNHLMPQSFVSFSYSKDKEQFWVINEYFITARR